MDEALLARPGAHRLDPYSAQAYCILGDLAAHDIYILTDADIKRIEELLAEGRQTVADACLLNFTLAAHWERKGDYDKSFDYYCRANELKLQVYRKDNRAFDQQKHRELVEGLIAVFTPEFVEKVRNLGIDSEVPIFVVGMVRSGTTLVEQILSSHPQVYGAGERKEIDQVSTTLHEQLQTKELYPACLTKLDAGWCGASPMATCKSWLAKREVRTESLTRCRTTTSTWA